MNGLSYARLFRRFTKAIPGKCTRITIIMKTINIRELNYIHPSAAAMIRLNTRWLLFCLLVIHPPVHPTRSRISSALSPGPRLALRSTGSAHVMRPHAPSLGVCCSLLCPWPFMPPVVPYPVFAPPPAELLFDNLLRVVTTEVPTLLPPGSWSYLIRLSR